MKNNTTELEELVNLANKLPVASQSDWAQTDETQYDYIKNKPEIISEAIENSESLITSGGVYEALKNIEITGGDGLSAYQIWLNEGNTGTEADFLASLKGEKGSDGSPYVLTDNDKIEIKNAVLNSLPTWQGGEY